MSVARPTLKVAALSGPRSGLYRKGKLAKLLGPLLFVLFFLMVGEKPAAGFATMVDYPLNCEYKSTLSPLSEWLLPWRFITATGNQIKVPGIWYIGAWASLVASPGVWEVQEHLLNTRWWPAYLLPNLFFLSQQCRLQGPTWLHLTLITSGKSHSQISLTWRFGGIIYSIRAWRAHSNHNTRIILARPPRDGKEMPGWPTWSTLEPGPGLVAPGIFCAICHGSGCPCSQNYI